MYIYIEDYRLENSLPYPAASLQYHGRTREAFHLNDEVENPHDPYLPTCEWMASVVNSDLFSLT